MAKNSSSLQLTDHLDTLSFFFDCMPSEQGSNFKSDYITYCGVAVLTWRDEYNKWKQYKQLRGVRRRTQATEIANAISNGNLLIIPIQAFCKAETAYKNGEQLSKELFGITKFKENHKYNFFVNELKINQTRTFMYANYAICISMLAYRAGQIAELYGCQNVQFILDRLPGDSSSNKANPGLEIMKVYIESCTLLKSMWLKAKRAHNLTNIGFYYIQQRDTYGDILADWLAQSYHAAINPASFSLNIQSEQENRRMEIANIAFSYHNYLIKNNYQDYFKPAVIPFINDFSGQIEI